jgi:adenine-specific DNA-methyltransferase
LYEKHDDISIGWIYPIGMIDLGGCMFDSKIELNAISQRMKSAGISDEEIDRLLSPIRNELNRRVCGLVWDHRNSSIPEMNSNFPSFTRKDEKCIIRGAGKDNLLIEGDNIYALIGLQYTHIDEQGKGLVDIIYIDPPYNIDASGVAYNDKFERSEWLSIMDIRLRLAKNVLADDGIILISIDDEFVSELRMLCSDIFGGKGTTFMIESSVIAGPRRVPAMQGSVVKTAEYVLAFRKDCATKIIRKLTFDYIRGFDTHYSKIIMNNEINKFVDVIKSNSDIAEEFKKHQLKIALDSIAPLIEVSKKVRDWLYSDEIAENLFREGNKEDLKEEADLHPTNTLFKVNNKWYVKNDKGVVHNVFRYKDRIGQCDDYFCSFGERQVRGNLWKGFSSDGGNLDKEGGVSFKSGKKPVRLIKQLLRSVGKSDATILDFFAGSGTTGQAVLELNKEDDGNRHFILCTNNEVSATQKLKFVQTYGYLKGYNPSSTTTDSAIENRIEKELEEQGLSLQKLIDRDVAHYEEYGICQAITLQRMKNIYPDYDDNLYYYQIDECSTNYDTEEETITELLCKFVSYVSIKEGTYSLTEKESWTILKDNLGKEVIVITNPELSLREIKRQTKDEFSNECTTRKIYCKASNREVDNTIELIPYPKEIMDIITSHKRDIIRGELR